MAIFDLDHLDVIVETSKILGGEAFVCIHPLGLGNLTTLLTKVANVSHADVSSDFDNGKGLLVSYQTGSSDRNGNKSYGLSAVWTSPDGSSALSLSKTVKVSS